MNDVKLWKARDEIERLRGDLKEANEAIRELNEAIRELQQEACDRAGVPMPSQRPLVERLREQCDELVSALEELQAMHLSTCAENVSLRALNDEQATTIRDVAAMGRRWHAINAELLAALGAIANGEGYYGEQARGYKQIARAAIAKAEGET
jgi:DNA repair exonuclease SbcCD ATPase subunit